MTSSSDISPKPYDSQKADEIWAFASEHAELPSDSRQLVRTLGGCSPFLARIIEREPAWLARVTSEDGHTLLEEILKGVGGPRPVGETRQQLMSVLRQAKARIALLTAWHDVGGTWTLDQVTSALTHFADAALSACTAHLLHEKARRGELVWANEVSEAADPADMEGCGYFVLALGKQGGFELNYSSDVDLIVLYDPSLIRYEGRKTLKDCLVRITQDLVQMMEQRTAEGYVFRTDLRLRPDPGATPLALSVEAAESYYHSVALNWERSAMIKARPVAGDLAAGQAYLDRMSSWVWRRHIDFEALRDIQSIKNQIKRHYGQQDLCFEGYDVKLGPGGIREIEFFAQINQLILGGRDTRLRKRRTLDTLEELTMQGRLAPVVLTGMTEAYQFLRTLEHRIQMINDEQTHTIPDGTEQTARLAAFMGYPDAGALSLELMMRTGQVKTWYDTLLPDDVDESAGFQEKAFAGLLAELEYPDPDRVLELVDGWRRGRYRALKSPRARQLLDDCLEPLVKSFAGTGDPMAAITRFDRFIGVLPSGVQLFSLFQSNPRLFDLVARIMGTAPGLAEQLSKRPTLWEAVLEPDFYDPVADCDGLANELEIAMRVARDYQDILDIARRWVAEKRFQVGVQTIENIASIGESGLALSNVADTVVASLVDAVSTEFSRRHGRFKGGEISILAMGKYGGQELTYTSDLDLVMLYHVADMSAESDGDRPISPSLYFSRLGQNIITALTALTSEGRLFEIDTRLRPSGNQGPLVVTLDTFRTYYSEAAWTWEHMALTRARVVVASDGFADRLRDTIRNTLVSGRDNAGLVAAVHKMRNLMRSEFPATSRWSMKHTRGGLVEMEFVVQYLMLRYGEKHPEVFEPGLPDAIFQLSEKGLLTPGEQEQLLEAHRLQQTVQAILRICHGHSRIGDEDFAPELRSILVESAGQNDFEALKNALEECQAGVYQLYQQFIGEPAEKLASQSSQENQ